MEKEFVSKDIALEMFNIGFDEPCVKFQWVDQDKPKWMGETNSPSKLHRQKYWKDESNLFTISIPTFSQCFRWFRDKYKLYHKIDVQDIELDLFDYEILEVKKGKFNNDLHREANLKSYQGAELACLKQSIVIVKTNNGK
jgi:hypothetical protein